MKIRVICGGAHETLRERKRMVHRLLETPEQVSREEARAFLDGIREEFLVFVRRQKLHETSRQTKTTRRRAGR